MNFLGHAIGAGATGIAAGALVMENGNSPQMALKVAGVLWIGGQIPDIDITSIPSRWFGRLGFLAAGLLFGYGFFARVFEAIAVSSIIGLAALLFMAMKHRGPLHKYWLSGFCLFLGFFRGDYLILAFGVGMITHLLLDRIFPWQFKGWWI